MPEIKKTERGDFRFDYSDMISPMDEIRRKVANAIAIDHEGKVRRALIELGWTPPGDKK